MVRGIRFWGRYTLETLAGGLIVALALLVLSGVGAGADSLPLILAGLPYYMAMGSALSILMVCYSTHLLYIPLVLSMGSTRREAFAGFLLFRVGAVVLPLLLSLVLWLLLPGQGAQAGLSQLPAVALPLLFAATLGSLMGLAYRRLKMLGIVLIMLLAAAVGAGTSLVFLEGMTADTFSSLFSAVDAALVPSLAVWAVLAAADLLTLHFSLRRREVRL